MAEAEIKLSGVPAVVVAIVAIVGLLVWKGPEGLKQFGLGADRYDARVSAEAMEKKGKPALQTALQTAYMQEFVQPLITVVQAKGDNGQKAAERIGDYTKRINGLEVTALEARSRYRMEPGTSSNQSRDIEVQVTYTMPGGSLDGRTQRAFLVEITRNGDGTWFVRREL